MKTKDIEPTSWDFALHNPKAGILMRKWKDIKKNVAHMETTLLELMGNPRTTPEQLSMAAKLYADTIAQLHETVKKIDECLYKRDTLTQQGENHGI